MTPARESSALWLDCGIGVAGDMLTGALVAVGADAARVSEAVLACARAAGAEGALGISFRPVVRAGIAATQVVVTALESSQPRRGLADITRILAAADLEPNVADDAGAVFALIAQAEAAVHGCDVEEVHFHEVGALDAIADVVAAVAAWHSLGGPLTQVSPVALGSGTVRMAHGALPVPAPAVARILRGAPTIAGPLPFEACTPTGAALAVHFARGRWGPCPPMTVEAQGYGAGSADPQGTPNVTRAILGRATAGGFSDPAPSGSRSAMPAAELLQELQANIDDLDPRAWPATIEALLAAGALDAWLTPTVMKRGRPAIALSVLCRPAEALALTTLIFELTPTLGVRRRYTERTALEREWLTVAVAGQPIQVKLGVLAGRVVTQQPEWRDVERAAEATGLAPRIVLQRATAAAATELGARAEADPRAGSDEGGAARRM